MRENARQGYWNGAPPPCSHRIAEAGQKGARIKKVLAIGEAEAGTVRRIFALHLGEDGVPLASRRSPTA
jgi:DNA invertase Pin-like site-specific DNA recombinase